MIVFGMPGGGHIIVIGGNSWGHTAFYMYTAAVTTTGEYEGRGFTPEDAVRNLWRKMHQ